MGDSFVSLSDLIIPRETVRMGDQAFQVRGLDGPDILFIVRHHRAVMVDLYDRALNGKLSGDMGQVAVEMGDSFFPIAGMVIACANEAPEAWEKTAKLPLPVMIDALHKVIHLTLVGENSLEKTMEIVMQGMTEVANHRSSLKT